MGAGAQKSGGAAALPAPPPPRSLNIDTFSFSKELESAWYITQLVQMIFIVLGLQKLPDFLGYVATLHKLKTLPTFWTLLLLLMMGLVRYVIFLALSKNLMTVLLTLYFSFSAAFSNS